MTQTRHSEFQTKRRREKAYHGVAITKDGAGPMAAAGRTAYRDEYQRDYGPDLDEPSDRTESGQEFQF